MPLGLSHLFMFLQVSKRFLPATLPSSAKIRSFIRSKIGSIILLVGGLFCSVFVAANDDEKAYHYDVHITVAFSAGESKARVSIDIPRSHLLNELDFSMAPPQFTDISANGRVKTEGKRLRWDPPNSAAALSYTVDLNEQKGGSEDSPRYSRYVGEEWAMIRGDDLVPPVVTSTVKRESKPESRTFLRLILPKGWKTAVGGWERISEEAVNGKQQITFRIDNPDRRFDRPTGWFALGRLGTRREQIGNTLFYIGAPKGSAIERLTTLALVTGVLPELQSLSATPPPYLTLVSAGEPMWRGGLSGPNSLFMHEDRPLISENGTSTLVHELFHSTTRIRGARDSDDWIAEGLAEYYSFEVLRRAGLMTTDRHALVLEKLKMWGEDVLTFRRGKSRAEITARAAVWFAELDSALGEGEVSLDALIKQLSAEREVSTEDLLEAIRARESKAQDRKKLRALLKSPLLG